MDDPRPGFGLGPVGKPGDIRFDDQDHIGVRQELHGVKAQVQRMIRREIQVKIAHGDGDGQRHPFAEFYELPHRRGILSPHGGNHQGIRSVFSNNAAWRMASASGPGFPYILGPAGV